MIDFNSISQTAANALINDICSKFDRYNDARAAQLDDIQSVRDAIYLTGSKNRFHNEFSLPDVWELAQTLKSHLIENLCASADNMFDVSGATLEAQNSANKQKAVLVSYFEKMNVQEELEKIIDSVVEAGEATLLVSWETKTRRHRRSYNQPVSSNFDGLEKGSSQSKCEQNYKKAVSDRTYNVGFIPNNLKTGHDMSCYDGSPDDNQTSDVVPAIEFVTEEKIIFDGPKIKFIPAEDFVFDPERLNSFDTAPKIYRSYAPVSEIRSNALYSLLNERKLLELTNMVNPTLNVRFSTAERPVNNFASARSSAHPSSHNAVTAGSAPATSTTSAGFSSAADGSKGVKGDQIELLEYWGDITIDGELFENMLVVIAGRKEILRLEQNPFITQPFVHASIITDPRTSRGVSPLKIALGISEISSNILNKQLDALSLIINPPYLAPRGCFKGEQVVSPGKIIEYDAALMPNQPIPLNFSAALQGWDFINFFKTSIESATGIYKTMAGNLSASARTATEINYSAAGQSARLNMIIDAVSRKIIVPMVEKTAQTLANFKLGAEEIAVKNGGKVEFITVSDDVRNGDYIYFYGDRRATLERKYRFKELFDIISQFAQRGDFVENINLAECFKFALEQYGIENTGKFMRN